MLLAAVAVNFEGSISPQGLSVRRPPVPYVESRMPLLVTAEKLNTPPMEEKVRPNRTELSKLGDTCWVVKPVGRACP